MNTAYLDTLPEVKNKFKVDLLPGEKVILCAKPHGFCTDADLLLGADDTKITMTNRRMIADNGNGLWIVDFAEDATDMRKVEKGTGWNKVVGIQLTMNKEITFGMGIQKLHGYLYAFKKKDMAKVEEIAAHMR